MTDSLVSQDRDWQPRQQFALCSSPSPCQPDAMVSRGPVEWEKMGDGERSIMRKQVASESCFSSFAIFTLPIFHPLGLSSEVPVLSGACIFPLEERFYSSKPQQWYHFPGTVYNGVVYTPLFSYFLNGC